MTAIEIIGIILVSLLLSAAIILIILSIGMYPGKAGKAKGYLESYQHRKNVYKGRTNRKWYKHYCHGVYSYRVNDKQYHMSYSCPGSPAELPRSLNVHYHKKWPRFSSIYDRPVMPITLAVLLAICALVISIPYFL